METKFTKRLSLATPVIQSTSLYYNVLLQYYSVLQGTPPVLLKKTNNHSRTEKNYSVLQSTTPVLLH